MKARQSSSQEKTHLVLATTSEFYIYVSKFERPPNTTKRLEKADQLHGITPSSHHVVILDGGWKASRQAYALLNQIEFWEARWRGMGCVERIHADELLGGPEIRRARLLAEYDKKMETVGINYLSQEVVRAWIMGLSNRDSLLLAQAVDARNTQRKAEKKTSSDPLPRL